MYGFRDINRREFPGSPEVRTPHLHCRGHASIPWRIKILQAATRSQNETKKKFMAIPFKVKHTGLRGSNFYV